MTLLQVKKKKKERGIFNKINNKPYLGWIGGAAGIIVGSPLDVLKVK